MSYSIRVALTSHHGPGGLNKVPLVVEPRKPKTEVLDGSHVCKESASWFADRGLPEASSHGGGQREEASSLVSPSPPLLRAVIPMQELHPRDLVTSQRPHPNTISWGVGFRPVNLRETQRGKELITVLQLRKLWPGSCQRRPTPRSLPLSRPFLCSQSS